MNALRLSAALYTLLVEDQGAELWDGEGRVLARLPELLPGQSARQRWGQLLQEHLPREAKVQFLVAKGNLEIQCQGAPYLSSREQREVAERMLQEEAQGQVWNSAFSFDADPQADGGHQVWVAGHPEADMEAWLTALEVPAASLVFATPWQRAFLAGMDGDQGIRFYLAAERGSCRLLLFHGRELVLMRAFRLPEDIDPAELAPEDLDLFSEIVIEEASRTVQFIKQKYRSLVLENLHLVGLPTLPPALAERLGRSVHLGVKLAGPSLPAFLLRGLERERARKGGLNLVPLHIQDALRLRVLRLTVWSAAALLVLGLGAAQVLMLRNERELGKILIAAEAAKEQRRRLTEEAEQVGKLRLGLIRVRHAEARQKAAAELLEDLGLRVFEVPSGITLEKVEVTQVPGEPLRYRFEILGTALTRQSFSMGPLADYLRRLERHPGMKLDPLGEVSVSDRTAVTGGTQGPTDRAVTRFKLTGVAS